MRWQYILYKLALFAFLALLLVSPGSARGNTTSGVYPGTVKDVCVGDTIFVGETGLNLTPLTPDARGVVTALQGGPPNSVSLPVSQSTNFNVGSVSSYGIYYPVVNGQVLNAYPIFIEPAVPNYPQNVVVTSSKSWVLADGTDSAAISITVTDGGNNPIPGADLTLAVSTPWGLQDSALKTDGSGRAQTLFLPSTKSGSAVISVSASVQGVTTAPVTTTLLQNIDAGTPFAAKPIFPGSITVGSPAGISVQVTDRYGNPVTSRRVLTNVSFTTTSSGTGRVFLDGMGNRLKAITVPLNDTGWAAVTFLVATVQGDNFVAITPPPPVSASLIDIVGIGDSKPFSISLVVTPDGNPPFILADDSSQATIDYYLFDQWGNPTADQAIQIVTSAGENKIFYTNDDGRATILYGPKRTAGYYSLTATAVANSTVAISQTLQFGSMYPTDMLLTASPQTMASLEVNPKMVGSVIAKVIDVSGNPVKGETVTFRIESSSNGTFVQTQDPAIGSGGVTTTVIGTPIPVITDENGQALLDYIPGAFAGYGSVYYSSTAQGTTTVNASWAPSSGLAVIRSINLSYKNYPFISVYTDVSPKTVQVGERVNISVILKGDGWALQPKPIDVVLCTDRSSSMLINESVVPSPIGKLTSESANDRMVDAMNAALTFVDQTTGQDRIGLVTFGNPWGGWALLNKTYTVQDQYISSDAWRVGKDYTCQQGSMCHNISSRDLSNKMPYILAHYPGHGTMGKDYRVNGVMTDAYVESNLTSTKSQIKDAIRSIVPAGQTPMRRGIYESVEMILHNNPRPEAVKAIILLTDGAYNQGGDPRGIVTSPFSIEAYPDVGAGQGGVPGTGSVISFAKANDIKIYTVALVGSDPADQPNLAELQAYADETGGTAYHTTNNTDLTGIYTKIAGQLKVDASVNTQVALDLSKMQVNTTYNLPGNQVFQYMHLRNQSTYVVPPDSSAAQWRDDTNNWTSGQSLTFSAGTIKVNQTWMVNFTLMTLIPGNIRVLSSKGSNSRITFVGTEGGVDIPDTFVTAVSPGTDKGPEGITCSFSALQRTDDSNTQIAELSWVSNYNGKQGQITWDVGVAQPYSTSYSWQDPFPYGAAANPVPYNLIIKDWSPGLYTIQVIGKVSDSSDCLGPILQITIPPPSAAPQILIQ